MAWHKINRKLTADMEARGVVFASQLVNRTFGETEETALMHEVIPGRDNVAEKIALLKDVRFFKSLARDERYNVTEIVYS